MENLDQAVLLLKEDLNARRYDDVVRSAEQFLITLGPDSRLQAVKAWAMRRGGNALSAAEQFNSAAADSGDQPQVLATCGAGLVACQAWVSGARLLERVRREFGLIDERAVAAEAVAKACSGDRAGALEAAGILRRMSVHHPALARVACELDPQLEADVLNKDAKVTEESGCWTVGWALFLLVATVATGGILAPIAIVLALFSMWSLRRKQRKVLASGLAKEHIPGTKAFKARIESVRYDRARCPRCNRETRFWAEAGVNVEEQSQAQYGFVVLCQKMLCRGESFDPPEDIGTKVLISNVVSHQLDLDLTRPAIFF